MLRSIVIALATAACAATTATAQTVPASADAVEQRLAQIAARVRTPAALGNGVVLTQVEARSNQLQLTVVSQARARGFTEQDRAVVVNDLCRFGAMAPLYAQGASVRATLYDFNGAEMGAVAVAAKDCARG